MSSDFGPPPPSSTKAIISLVLGLMSFLMCITGIPAAVLGALALGDISRNPRTVGGKGMAIAGICTGIGGMGVGTIFLLLALLLPAVQGARMAARKVHSINNMKQIGLGMLMSETVERQLPNDIEDADGKPLLSWRVRLLPYMEQQALYNQFRLNEPWDSPHNLALAAKMPPTYQSPFFDAEPAGNPGKTTYLRPKSREAVFGPMDGNKQARSTIAQIRDGTSNTLMLVEANRDLAVVWTKPQDLDIDPTNPRRGLGDSVPPQGSFLGLFVDCSVFVISGKATNETLRKLFARADGQAIYTEEYQGR